MSLVPAESKSTDPNLGGWFVFNMSPGETTSGKARMTNVAPVPQKVKLYFGDLRFNRNGAPVVVDSNPTDVGSWGRFPEPVITIGAKTTVDAQFVISVPNNADPGDHVGVIIAESEPESGQLRVVKRIATRLYVTLPGEAVRDFEIKSVKIEPESWFFPKTALVKVMLENTGRIRLNPKVTARGARLKGSEVLLSRSREEYVNDIEVPWYGGPVRVPVEASADRGLTSRVNASIFVMPWMLMMLTLIVATAGFLTRKAWMNRGSRYAALQTDLRRLETLIAQRQLGQPESVPVVEEDEEEDELAALMAAVKRARRTGAQESLERLGLMLHELRATEALEVLLDAAEKASGKRRVELINAVRTYGSDVVDQALKRRHFDDALSEELRSPPPRTQRPSKPKGPAPKPKPQRTTRRPPKTHAQKKKQS